MICFYSPLVISQILTVESAEAVARIPLAIGLNWASVTFLLINFIEKLFFSDLLEFEVVQLNLYQNFGEFSKLWPFYHHYKLQVSLVINLNLIIPSSNGQKSKSSTGPLWPTILGHETSIFLDWPTLTTQSIPPP